MSGPYQVIDGKNHHTVARGDTNIHLHTDKKSAELLCSQLNDAYAAGCADAIAKLEKWKTAAAVSQAREQAERTQP